MSKVKVQDEGETWGVLDLSTTPRRVNLVVLCTLDQRVRIKNCFVIHAKSEGTFNSSSTQFQLEILVMLVWCLSVISAQPRCTGETRTNASETVK